ncbi:MAG: branched-chain amino acid ABC transporter permease, partial [Methylobacteriaceae bacterium]|nr:branched-chain amino acid ABC transporter permease [Methylobacteriaceae bacterium]
MAWHGALPNIRAWPDAAGIGSIALTILAGYLVFPDDLALLARILATSLLVVSLDLLVGFCGIITLGQAALFGAGAYAAGIAAVRGLSEPFSLLAIGAAAGGLTGLVSGAIILRARGLAQLVLSIA